MLNREFPDIPIEFHGHNDRGLALSLVGRKSKCHNNKQYQIDDFILEPFVKGSSELRYHRDGPGVRHVMIDERNSRLTHQYIITRKVNSLDGSVEAHVDSHIHNCDSVFQFLGDGEGYIGLVVEVTIDGMTRQLESPATVFIPSGISHTYRFISGSGTFIIQ